MTVAREAKMAYDRELAQYPGVRWSYGWTKKHQKLVLVFNGQQRTHIFSTSTGDQRARQAGVSDVRRTLRDLGAEKRP